MNKPLEIELPEKATDVVVDTPETNQLMVIQNPYEKLVQDAFARGDLSIVEKAMTLQLRWEDAQARRDFDEAIAAAKAEIPLIIKNRQALNGKYADFAAIASVVDPIISKYGLSYRFRTLQNDRINVTCVLSHKSGHSEENTLSGPPDKTGSKNEIQAIGSTLSYLSRYSLVQALGLAASNDDDGKLSEASAQTISDEQIEVISARIRKSKADLPKFLAWVGVEEIQMIPASRFNACLAALDQVQTKKQQQARGNAQRQQS